MTHPAKAEPAPKTGGSHINKDELLETIRVAHRQLERYLFPFEKDRQGVFVASDRPRFGPAEMLQLANTANHYRWAKDQIRGWQRSQDKA